MTADMMHEPSLRARIESASFQPGFQLTVQVGIVAIVPRRPIFPG